ncbi:hypothetical protein ABL78_6475 [Leptomonas seymouri]|uniref:C2 domain-containing protein n=1 Tax=Leptomonas seymouri TaxID=5684 RepID=A0A0N0P3S5_LEPSE|nr:hypothetical protein ABL78_6475 [Leptomonas seymouri]|eukprot:KPI84469.1 hypothetical protein ABL78_6475 [Leptomonas seymouri]
MDSLTSPPPQQQQEAPPAAVATAGPTYDRPHASAFGPGLPSARPPDAFAVSNASADPLLAGLQLAQERLAVCLSQSADAHLYHGGAVTSLRVPVEAQPPPPLYRDVVDAVEAAGAGVGYGDGDPQQRPGEAGSHKSNVRDHKAKGEERQQQALCSHHQEQRRMSRRQREHAKRVEAALNPAFVIEMRERMPAPAQRSSQANDVEALDGSSSSSRSTPMGKGQTSPPQAKHVSPRRAGVADDHQPQQQQQHRRHRHASEDVAKTKSHRRRRRREGEMEQPAAADLDAHPRDLLHVGDRTAVVVEAAAATPDEPHEAQRESYRPDDGDASEYVEERLRLLQQNDSDSTDTDACALKGCALYVRPAEHFQSGPVPVWMQHYSDLLLFDAHRLDHGDATMLQQAQAARDASRGHNVCTQLPVDAVVLRLRGDIARARRLRDELQKHRGVSCSLFSGTHTDRYEVYSPTAMDWEAETQAAGPQLESIDLHSSTNDESEMQAAVPAKIAEPCASPPDAGHDECAAIVVPAADGAAHKDEDTHRNSVSPAQASPPRRRSLLLARSLEARDLQRPLLAQTIPVWRRRGAAVKLLSELIEFLEDRLRTFGKQLDDPTQGPTLELIGAPDSSGVDGSVRATYPPVLEHALRAIITNTLVSDVFATPRSALGSRALRLSEALRRRQTPYVHDVYLTQLEHRPVYDYTALCITPSILQAYSSAGREGERRQAHGMGAAAVAGVDSRQSYSIHVDYVRFQPSFENPAVNALRTGNFAGAPAVGSRVQTSSPVEPSTSLSSPVDELSSMLLGSYLSVFLKEKRDSASWTSALPSTLEPAVHEGYGSDAGRRGSLGTDNVGSTTAALLRALSAAASQSRLVAYTPEAYLTSLILRYYEQYRMLQLNLLPSLKNRFFYQEQIAQLQQQQRRNTELNKLQARLEELAETSANVERGCLHAMILLWSAVLEQRRRRRRRSSFLSQHVSAPDLHHTTAASGAWMSNQDDEPEEEETPFIIECSSKPAAAAQHHREGRHGSRRQRSGGNTEGDGRQSAPPPLPITPEELRPHPPVYPDEQAQRSPGSVVHLADDTVMYNDGPEAAREAMRRSARSNAAKDSKAVPSPLVFLSSSPDTRALPASSSPLLAPSSLVSSVEDDRNGSNSSSARAGLEAAGLSAAAPPLPLPPPPPAAAATRFRFFLRRYGTTEEVPYRMGDDLLWYAAEVDGTDVVATTGAGPAAGPGAGVGSAHPRLAPDAPSGVAPHDNLLYFQLVVFARSKSATVPQYVGCTTPRPMTTAKVIFFNETFELRALHEPVELLLHLIPVTAGPSKATVVSTIRLRPTLTRRYALLPLQPPTAFMFHGKLFSRHSTSTSPSASAANGGVSALAEAPLSGVLAVSTTWTTIQGLSIPQMEHILLHGGGSGGSADPLDPQYLPLLRTLRTYYTALDSARVSTARARNRGKAKRTKSHGAARAALGEAASLDGSAAHPHHLLVGRRTRSAVQLRPRRASVSLRRQLGTLVPSAPRHATAARASSLCLPSRVGRPVAAEEAAVAAAMARPGFDGGHVSQVTAPQTAPSSVLAVVAGVRDYVVEALQARLPTARLQYLFRRWLIKTGRLNPADELESRMLARPIPLNDADAHLLRKRVLRELEKEEDVQSKECSEAGLQYDAERYYKAPSSISGLALSNLPRETKLKLWRERQRRLVLTLKRSRHVADAEKLETIVRVPKLATIMVFDFAPRSQLNPHRKERPKTEDIDRALLKRRRDSRIVIHIMKVHNLPYRADGTPLEPFVQASFVSEAAYTRSEVGSSPSWFQTLELPFQPLDFEEDTLSMIDDDIVVSIYDKVEVKMASSAATTAAVAHETHYRTERRFIGTLRVPFYSLHQAREARMEGVYPLRTPRWLLGYDMMAASDDTNTDTPYVPPTAAAAADAVDAGGASVNGVTWDNPFVSTEGGGAMSPSAFPPAADGPSSAAAASSDFREQQVSEPTVQLYLSLWPPLQRDPPKRLSKAELHRRVYSLFVSPQLHHLHRVALKWQQTALRRVKSIATMNARATARPIEPFVVCSTGDLVLVCRYMLPHGGAPPPSVRTIYEAIRYVSLLPFVADMMSFGEKDVWSTNAELLAMRSGDYEELALLLVHFLRNLAPDRPSYVVLGTGSIYQQTILVLHECADKELYLIDPRSGSTVPAGKPYGTLLQDVSMVVSHDQMWANTQLSGLPHRMAWDLHNPAHWLPCFDAAKDRRIPACIPCLCPIQREVLDFPPADPVKSREIEVELRACLKKALLTWRNGCPPAYHRGVEAILRDLLEAAEEERCTCGSAQRAAITRSAAARLSEYFGESVTGCPMPPQKDEREESKEKQRGGAGRRRQTASSHRQRHHSRHRDPAREKEGPYDDDAAVEHGKAGSRGVSPPVGASPPSPVLRLLGSPVMGSYNPSDPQFEELLQQVFEGAVHEVGTNDVSFAAGVYVKSYTGDVCAMWLFLVAICRG